MEGVFAVWLAFAAALVAALEYFVRPRLVRHVQAQMHVAATTPTAAAVPAASPPAEVEAAGSLDHSFHTAYEPLPQAVAARALWTSRALRLMRLLLWSELAAAAAYVGLPLLLGWSFNVAAGLGLLLALMLALVAAVRHAIGRRQYRVSELRFVTLTLRRRLWNGVVTVLSWVAAAGIAAVALVAAVASAIPGVHLVLYAVRFVPKVFTPRVRFLLSGLFVVFGAFTGLGIAAGASGETSAALPERLGGAGLLLAALLHGGGLFAVAARLRRTPGSSLLVLRVFEHDEATDFTFNRVMKYWRLFGHHFTVVDGALVRGAGKHALGWGARLTLFGLFAAVFALVEVHPVLPLAAIPFVFIGLTWGVLALGRRSIDRRFVRSREQLLCRLQRLEDRPRNLDLGFRHERAMCHDDTWFMTVGEFARRAQVVLMDLRGFSKERQGCQTEIDFLFDTVPVQRIVFLIDTQADPELFVHTLSERWRMQRPDSPNVAALEPVVSVYIVARADEHDVQALVDLLILAAQAPAVPAPEPQDVLAAGVVPASAAVAG